MSEVNFEILEECPSCMSIFDDEEDDLSQSIKLPCGCRGCLGCIVSWVNLQVKEPSYVQKEKISCIVSSCKKPFKLQDIRTHLRQEDHETINDSLLQVYLTNAKDISSCPTQGCQYAGVYNPSFDCTEALQCGLCNTEWKQPTMKLTERIMLLVFTLQGLREVFSSLRKFIMTKKCPMCNTRIEKNGGCDHMTCRCGHNFCWICGKYPNHYKFIHLMRIVFLVISGLVGLFLTLYLLWQIPFMKKVMQWILNRILDFVLLTLVDIALRKGILKKK